MTEIRRVINELKPLTTEIYKSGQIKQPNYILPMVLAAAQGLCVGARSLVAMEFGVASGRGLFSLLKIAERVTHATGVEFEVFGFDTFGGLPPPNDYRDHPEIWSQGQYAPPDFAKLRSQLPGNCELIVGNVDDTVPAFVRQRLSESSPVGFVSIDLDFYSSTMTALEVLKSAPKLYLPAVLMYFDDIDGNLTLNAWAGEELAINEFNAATPWRKIQRKVANSPKMFCAHVLDHPVRTGAAAPLEAIDLPVSMFQRAG